MKDKMNEKEILSNKYDVNLIVEFNWWWYKKLGDKKIQSTKADFIDFIKERKDEKYDLTTNQKTVNNER